MNWDGRKTLNGGLSGSIADHGKYRIPKQRLNVLCSPHAILNSDGQVVAIRPYPPGAQALSIIRIPEELEPYVKVGWFWTGSKFQKEKPNV